MYTHCVDCGASIYDSKIDLCDDCEHKYESPPQNNWWRYEMHREMAVLAAEKSSKQTQSGIVNHE